MSYTEMIVAVLGIVAGFTIGLWLGIFLGKGNYVEM